jgi:hypothetical protein
LGIGFRLLFNPIPFPPTPAQVLEICCGNLTKINEGQSKIKVILTGSESYFIKNAGYGSLKIIRISNAGKK